MEKLDKNDSCINSVFGKRWKISDIFKRVHDIYKYPVAALKQTAKKLKSKVGELQKHFMKTISVIDFIKQEMYNKKDELQKLPPQSLWFL